MNPTYVTILLSVVIYFISHRRLKTFNSVAWISLSLGLILATIYGMMTDDLFKSIPLNRNSDRISVVAGIFGGNFAGSLVAFLIIAYIDRRIYGKEARK